MAQQGVQLYRDQFCCSICLDLLKDPVTIPCGHSYCMGCIKGYWDQDDQKEFYSCPQCRQTFTPRPVLKKNNMLAEVVETLKEIRRQAAPPDHCYSGPGDVACDFCTGRKQKALKSCMVCLASYCETHIQPHYQSAAFKKHKLVKASTRLQENICSRHDKLLDVFCCTDQQCICYLCSMDEHKGHDTVSAAAVRTERQKELGMSQQKIQGRVQEREKDVKVLQQEVESINRSADEAVAYSERNFKELIQSLERRRSEVTKLIRAQQRAAVTQTDNLRKQLELGLAELRRRDAELEQLSNTEDHIHFLQSYPSLSSPSKSVDLPSINARPLLNFRELSEAVSKLKEKLDSMLREEWPTISTAVKKMDVFQPTSEHKTRADFLRYCCGITLDPNTANTHLSLSNGNRKATLMKHEQSYPNHPQRVIEWWQVVGIEGLIGRCYWEVEWSGWVYIAASYRDIVRKGTLIDCGFGNNPKSWALDCKQNGYSFRHNNIETKVSGPRSSRIGVYLDHKAGTLSFYSVSDTMTLLHRVNTTFAQPLYAGFWFQTHPGNAELRELK